MKGQRVCRKHGGESPQALAAAERRIEHEERIRALGSFGELLEEVRRQPVPDSLTALEDAYGAAFHMTAALRILVEESNSVLGINRFAEDVVHPLTSLYGEWLDRYARIHKLALDAGIEERRAKADDAQVERLFRAIGRALASVELTPEQQENFRRRLAAELRGEEST